MSILGANADVKYCFTKEPEFDIVGEFIFQENLQLTENEIEQLGLQIEEIIDFMVEKYCGY